MVCIPNMVTELLYTMRRWSLALATRSVTKICTSGNNKLISDLNVQNLKQKKTKKFLHGYSWN